MIPIIVTIAIIFLITTVVLVFFKTAPQIGTKAVGKRLERIKSSPRFINGQFSNVIDTSIDMSFRLIMKTMYEVIKGDKSRSPLKPIQTIKFDAKEFNEAGNEGEAAITWFGHSSLLIKIHGKVFLTDPVLAGERVSMLSFMGPKRFPYSNYVQIGELPAIDAILLSHDHYDHLDYPTIRLLKDKAKQFIVPLGVGAHLEGWGVPAFNISEYDWWDEIQFDKNISLVCTPSRHFSGRSITGRNTTLWCSWLISGLKQRLYFGADSGYSPTFKEIGKKYAPIDLAILECGAYSEYWPAIHMMPEETLQAYLDLNGKKLMPIHWGKFNLSLHGWKEPIQRLKKSAALNNVEVVTPKIGAIMRLGSTESFLDWWDD